MKHDRPALDAWVEQGEAGLLSVVIPARDEEGHLPPTLRALASALHAASIRFEIVVVDDGSTDRTVEVVEELQSEVPEVRVVRNGPPHGYGYAVRAGLSAFRGDAVAIVMADGSDDPDDLVRFYRRFQQGVDCVFGSRFMQGGAALDYPLPKYLLNRLSNTFIRLLFLLRYNDLTNAFKLFGRHVIAGLQPLLSYHFNLTVELPLKAIVRGYSYAVLPNTWRNRVEGISKFKIREMGSRYLFIVFYCWLERQLSRGDYLRSDVAASASDGDPVEIRRPFGWTRAGFTLLLFGLLAVHVPDLGPPGVLYDHLDGSWRAIFDHFAFSTVQYGTELVYTLGPLGFLRFSIGAPDTIWYVVLWGVLLAAALTGGFVLLFARSTRGAFALGWCGFALLPLFVNLPGDYLYPLAIVLCFAQVRKAHARPSVGEALVVLAMAIGAWIVFTYLVLSLAVVTVVSAAAFVRFRRWPWHAPLFVAASLLIWLGLHQPLANLGPFWSNTSEVARGYSDLMSHPGPVWEVLSAIAVFAGILILLSGLRHRWPAVVTLALTTGVSITWFFAFKSAFVRHDGRRPVVILGTTLVAVLGYLAESGAWPRLREQVVRRRCVAPLLVIVIAASWVGRQAGYPERTGGMSWIYQQERTRFLLAPTMLFTAGATENVERTVQARARARVPLPPLTGSVDWFGNGPAILLTYPVDYRPRPVFQNFVAYTPALAELNAEYYRGSRAPETVVVDLQSFDNTPTLMLDARAALELVARYQRTETVDGRLILARRDAPRRVVRTLVMSRTMELGETLDIGAFSHGSPIWAEIDVSRTLLGLAADAALKIPRLTLRLQLGSGATHDFRFAAEAARGGFLLSPLIMNNEQFALFVDDPADLPPPRRVASLSIVEPSWPSSFLRGRATVRIFMLALRESAGPEAPTP